MAWSPSDSMRPYQPGKRAMLKIKHQRTADCVVAGFRWHKNGPGHPRRVAAARPVRRRGHAPSRRGHVVVHVGQAGRARRGAGAAARRTPSRTIPWREWAEWATTGDADASGQRLPGATSRWNRGKDLSWEPLAHGARRGGRLRPPPGRPVPARDDVQALAPGQAAGGLPLRPARGERAVPARQHLRQPGLTWLLSGSASSAVAGSAANTSRRSSGSAGPSWSASSRGRPRPGMPSRPAGAGRATTTSTRCWPRRSRMSSTWRCRRIGRWRSASGWSRPASRS